MPIWLNARDIEALLTMTDAITAVEEAFRQLALGAVILPPRVGIGMARHGGGGAAMPAYVGGEINGLGLKLVTLYPDNPARYGLAAVQATLVLLDPCNGQLLAVMDAGALTALRTGAAGGVAARYLARQGATRATVFGAGVQGRAQLEALCAVRPIQRAWIVDRVPAAAHAFAAEMSARLGLSVAPATDLAAAVTDADVILTATTAHEPLFDGAWLQPGVHINGIGSHAPAARELDTATIQRARVVTDQTAACLAEAGDLIIPLRAGAIAETHIAAQLGEVILGLKPGRTAEDEITLFKSVGLAIQDIAVAAQVYRQALATGRGQPLLNE
jgi:alanine dehydrogenase